MCCFVQDLGAIIRNGVDEGRITLADIHRLRNRLQGDLKAMCKGEVLANPTWQPLTSRDEEGARCVQCAPRLGNPRAMSVFPCCRTCTHIAIFVISNSLDDIVSGVHPLRCG